MINSIWKLQGNNGEVLNYQEFLMVGGSKFFEDLFSDPKVNRIEEQLQVIEDFPKKK